MDDKTLTALRGSIKKWEDIVAGTGADEGCANCPLCDLFYNHTGSCSGCPVSASTGLGGCNNTPYSDEWVEEWNSLAVVYANLAHGDKTPLDQIPNVELRERLRAAAQKELDFLKSLLPEEAGA